ncbi:AraC family transcriptional regulator [Roseateles sp. DAIF2]|uniref:GyrI-like domain-containing protein n=1 Tax=Roseateles sp. DAIF2 TaxID=2714952 RepID=UPI0018A26C6B|nr:effector binding domain-containing protein [Roseateles sp. DAIF2]QPF72119.1 AraC family transcriptional regulator [Roseateles sp. DAIF2]
MTTSKMTTEQQTQALHVIGLELRTSNQQAFSTIPAHWRRFTEEAVLQRLAGRIGEEVYAVYTHFEHAGRNNEGLYSLVIGAAMPAGAEVPAGLTRVVAPASARAVFPVEAGRFDLVGPAWQEIWQRRELRKTYVADYERYRADGAIEICIGIEPGAAAA